MTDEKLRNAKEAKKSLYETYKPLVEARGFSMAHGLGRNENGNFTLEVRLQPLPGRTIDDLLVEEVKTKVLPQEYEGYQVRVVYLPKVTPREC